MLKNKHIAILGAGNLGIAIAEGIVDAGLRPAQEVHVTRRNVNHLVEQTARGYLTGADNAKAVRESGLVILCVQPSQLSGIIKEINPHLNKDHVVVSVITGVSVEEIAYQLSLEVPVVRAMPNTAIAIGESMTCICSPENGSHLDAVKEVFDAVGQTMVIDEKLMQAATVLGASGIAFFMRYLRAATQGGVQMGFHSDEAQLIAVQTAKGAASLILENNNHPEVEIDKVTTPQGCTIAGLNEMEHRGMSSALIKGIMASFNKINNIR